MEKFETGGFSNDKGLFIHTSVELCGKLEEKTLFLHEPLTIPEELRKAIAKSLSEQKGNIEEQYGKENSKYSWNGIHSCRV